MAFKMKLQIKLHTQGLLPLKVFEQFFHFNNLQFEKTRLKIVNRIFFCSNKSSPLFNVNKLLFLKLTFCSTTIECNNLCAYKKTMNKY
jgi:hypothetical protein